MAGGLDRAKALDGALRLWANIMDGRSGDLLDPGSGHVVASAVGGYLLTEQGTLRRADELRFLLRSWLKPRKRKDSESAAAIEFDVFLVSWGLSGRSEAMDRWKLTGSPHQTDPIAHIGRAVGFGAEAPSAFAEMRYPYLGSGDWDPDGAVAGLVDAGVRALLNAEVAWGSPKRSRLEADMRQWLSPQVAAQIRLFDESTFRPGPTPTTAVTRLAFVLATGAALSRYVDAYAKGSAQAETLLQQWSDPPELSELRRLCLDYSILGDADANRQREDLGVEFADFRAVFRTFAERGRDLGRASSSESQPPQDSVETRRLGVLLELAIADTRASLSDLHSGVGEQLTVLIEMVAETIARQRGIRTMLDFQKMLHTKQFRRRTGGGQERQSSIDMPGLLAKLASENKVGTPVLSRSDSAPNWEEIDRLVYDADQYLRGNNRYGPERMLKQLADSLPDAVSALTTGSNRQAGLGLSVEEARWQLLLASSHALVRRPDARGSIIVAGSFAELGWVVANDRTPDEMRRVTDPVQQELRKIPENELAYDLAGAVTRIMRTRPLADSKNANFAKAQLAAYESVIYGSKALHDAMHDERIMSVSRIAAALTGLQLSLLQAGGVYVRSAETELIVPSGQRTKAERKRHLAQIRDLATSSYSFINLAVARMHDIRSIQRTGLLTSAELNFPPASAASTAAMGMRTLLLWATMHLAHPDGRAREVNKLVPSVPAQFCEMLNLHSLTNLNFGDLTRIAMHYAFLSGDFRHPARAARRLHPQTPAHLRPRGDDPLDLDACGRYLTENNFDTGILDVVQVSEVRRTLDETSGGRYGDWLAGYENPRKRKPERVKV